MVPRMVPFLLALGLILALAPAASAQPTLDAWVDDNGRQVRTYWSGTGRGVEIAVDLWAGIHDVTGNGPDPSDQTIQALAYARCTVRGARRCQIDRINMGYVGVGEVQATFPGPGGSPANSGTSGTARALTDSVPPQDPCQEHVAALYVSVRNRDGTLSRYRLPTDPPQPWSWQGPLSGCQPPG
jgi:hypothetical protein